MAKVRARHGEPGGEGIQPPLELAVFLEAVVDRMLEVERCLDAAGPGLDE
jgi:hypothetical protein